MSPFRLTIAAGTLGLCIALGPAIAGFFVYQGIMGFKMADRYVTAKGLAERIEKSDRGTWEITVKVTGNDLHHLYTKLAEDVTQIIHLLRNEGFEPNEISLSSYPLVEDLLSRRSGNDPMPPERYQVERKVSVESHKVDILSSLSNKVEILVSQGITISSVNARYYLDRFNALRPGLIEEATKNAQQVAQSFAKTTGTKIGGIRKANQGIIRLTSPDALPNDEYDSGTDSLMKKMRVVTTLEFFLK
ncbi:MAG: hypothetical protein BGO67_02560 [Alphaproteobacteria bacterium 41-28]|nr:MAG: hypothetical protein BGO67_02560 [Alphaproteobacteria bacterium 41-28]